MKSEHVGLALFAGRAGRARAGELTVHGLGGEGTGKRAHRPPPPLDATGGRPCPGQDFTVCRGCMLGVDGGFVPELAGPRVDHRRSGSLTVFLFVWGFAVSKLKCSPRTATDRLALPGSTLNQDA